MLMSRGICPSVQGSASQQGDSQQRSETSREILTLVREGENQAHAHATLRRPRFGCGTSHRAFHIMTSMPLGPITGQLSHDKHNRLGAGHAAIVPSCMADLVLSSVVQPEFLTCRTKTPDHLLGTLHPNPDLVTTFRHVRQVLNLINPRRQLIIKHQPSPAKWQNTRTLTAGPGPELPPESGPGRPRTSPHALPARRSSDPSMGLPLSLSTTLWSLRPRKLGTATAPTSAVT